MRCCGRSKGARISVIEDVAAEGVVETRVRVVVRVALYDSLAISQLWRVLGKVDGRVADVLFAFGAQVAS